MIRVPDAGYWMLDAGYWMLDTGCWILDTGYWIPDTGCWMLDRMMNSFKVIVRMSKPVMSSGGM